MLFTTKYLIRDNISLYRYLINPYFAFKKVKFRRKSSEDTTNFKKIYTRYQEQQQWRRIYIVFLIKT